MKKKNEKEDKYKNYKYCFSHYNCKMCSKYHNCYLDEEKEYLKMLNDEKQNSKK